MLTIRNVDPEELPMGLLLLADPSEQRIRRYLIGAHAFAASKTAGPVGVLVMRWRNGDEAEIMNVAVALEHQRTGIGRATMEFAVEYARVRGATTVSVGTGNSSLGELRFYQRLGFRITGVSRDYFGDYDPPIFEEGIRCLDMIHLSRALR
jgi:ribosomal protein S18 acetylase RimI-like enzyme